MLCVYVCINLMYMYILSPHCTTDLLLNLTLAAAVE